VLAGLATSAVQSQQATSASILPPQKQKMFK
jgi:hypothetical protein